MKWPIDYKKYFLERIDRLQKIEKLKLQAHAYQYYSQNPIDFIEHWCITYDARNTFSDTPTTMPFILFDKQKELVNTIIYDCLANNESLLVEKSRDMGATWVCCAVSVWLWLFRNGASVGWGSMTAVKVDRVGDPDTIFEKIRKIINYLPHFLKPGAFKPWDHLTLMKCINPDNGATITGESGDDIGRGGRKLIYFKDESSHYKRPEKIEAALADNTNVQVDISSVNGAGNVFYRKRHSQSVRVFIMDWRDHPGKNQEWYDKRKSDATKQGIAHIFASEVDRDYHASVEGMLIPRSHADAIIDAHKKLNMDPSGANRAGLDVADEGGDANAFISMHGNAITRIERWYEGDTSDTAIRAYNLAVEMQCGKIIFDRIGVGAGVRAYFNKIENKQKMYFVPYSAGSKKIRHPKKYYTSGIRNIDMFENVKAQDFWFLKMCCMNTYNAINGKSYDESMVISVSSEFELTNDLINEISNVKEMRTKEGKIIIESKKDLKKRGVQSHNLADSLIQCLANPGGKKFFSG